MIPSIRQSSRHASISPCEVTHTGHPGPEIREIVSGRRERIPYLKMDIVWVPHTSIRRICFLLIPRIRWESLPAISGSLYSSTCFMVESSLSPSAFPLPTFFKRFPEDPERLPGFLLVNGVDGKTGMDDHVVSQSGVFEQEKTRFPPDTLHIDHGHS